jgi:hypothetical protein
MHMQEFFDMVRAWVPALNCVPEFVLNFDYRFVHSKRAFKIIIPVLC